MSATAAAAVLLFILGVLWATPTCMVLDFDDVTQTTVYGTLRNPYHHFVFEHGDPSWVVKEIGLLNTRATTAPALCRMAPSLPNSLIASGDIMCLRPSKVGTFDFLSLYIKTIGQRQSIAISTSTSGERLASDERLIEVEGARLVTLDLFNLTHLCLGCVTHSPTDICGPILYDDFHLCLSSP